MLLPKLITEFHRYIRPSLYKSIIYSAPFANPSFLFVSLSLYYAVAYFYTRASLKEEGCWRENDINKITKRNSKYAGSRACQGIILISRYDQRWHIDNVFHLKLVVVGLMLLQSNQHINTIKYCMKAGFCLLNMVYYS